MMGFGPHRLRPEGISATLVAAITSEESETGDAKTWAKARVFLFLRTKCPAGIPNRRRSPHGQDHDREEERHQNAVLLEQPGLGSEESHRLQEDLGRDQEDDRRALRRGREPIP